jgi:hypothetical protein
MCQFPVLGQKLLLKKSILKRDGRYSRDIYLLDKRALRPLFNEAGKYRF